LATQDLPVGFPFHFAEELRRDRIERQGTNATNRALGLGEAIKRMSSLCGAPAQYSQLVGDSALVDCETCLNILAHRTEQLLTGPVCRICLGSGMNSQNKDVCVFCNGSGHE